jgi:alkanesulfonate monooxygenase SsuD/methylene tetrahydromethanopterin reductase-like flavin-dependent oxidoreductase (luciferase family)
VYAYVHVGVADRDAAAEAARRDLFSYAVVDAYARAFSRAGYADAVAEIRERHAARDRDGAVAAVSDAMVDEIDIVGDAAHVAAAVDAYRAAGVDVPVIMPLPWGEDRREVLSDTLAAAAPASSSA